MSLWCCSSLKKAACLPPPAANFSYPALPEEPDEGVDQLQSPAQRRLYPYDCPICLRYYQTMHKTTCCHNYTCHFCLDLMVK